MCVAALLVQVVWIWRDRVLMSLPDGWEIGAIGSVRLVVAFGPVLGAIGSLC